MKNSSWTQLSFLVFALTLRMGVSVSSAAIQVNSYADATRQVQPNIVKIFGAGGLRGLESYQSGFLISNEGHVLTVWSYVLDTEYVTVVLDDGRKFQGELVGVDPRLEIAIVKIDTEGVRHFKLDEAVEVDSGDRVLAFGNLFGIANGNEPASVLHGHIATQTRLSARRGAYRTRYQGPVYVVDAMTNNPGAAGGALTNHQGQLVGLLGKELRNAHNNTWLNYAIPVSELEDSVRDILSGKILSRAARPDEKLPRESHNLAELGIVLVPEILQKTPPYVERVPADTLAARAEVQADDLILFVGDRAVTSIAQLKLELQRIDQLDELRLLILRDEMLIEVVLGRK